MKELQAGIQLVRTKYLRQQRRPVPKKKALKPKAVKALPPQLSERPKPVLTFPVNSSLEVLQRRTVEGLKRLKHQELRINQLSAELETAMVEFKAIASEINRDWKAFQAVREPRSAIAEICEYQAVKVPNIHQKPSGSFILTSRTIDLFKAEREAAVLAQTLRYRAKRKRGKC
jgi:hypothetical protein